MYARSVSIRIGMAVTSILLIARGIPAKASEVTITVTGTSNGGKDMFGIFGMPGNIFPAGTPFTLVFTFDEAKGTSAFNGPCNIGGSGIVGAGVGSPGKAVLTINDKTYEFGTRPNAKSRTWRGVPTACSQSEIGINIQEGPYPLESGVDIKIHASPGKVLTRDRNWKGEIMLSDFDARSGENAFAIRRPGNYTQETKSFLNVATVTVTRSAGTAPATPVNAAPAKQYKPGFVVPK